MTAQSPVHTLSRSNSTPTEGLGVVDDIYRNAVDISNGDFASVQAMIDNARSGMMCLAADPVDFFGQMAVSFILEHVDPLNNMLNDFTGDSAEVFGMSDSWQSIADSLASVADEIDTTSSSAMSDMAGQAVDAYLHRQEVVSSAMRAVSENASSFSTTLNDAANIVDAIHDIVRDAIADVVATCISGVFWSCVTAGVASPVEGAKVSGKVTSWVVTIAQIGQALIQLLQSIQRVFDNLDSIQTGLTNEVKVIGANCTMPAGGCCGATASTADLSSPLTGNSGVTSNGQTGGTNVYANNGGTAVGGDNNGVINNGGTINNDNSTTTVDVDVNPTFTHQGDGSSDSKTDDKSGSQHGHSDAKPDKSGSQHGHSDAKPDKSGSQHGHSDAKPDKSGSQHGHSDAKPDKSGSQHGHSDAKPDKSGSQHGHSDTKPDKSGSQHGHNDAKPDKSGSQHGHNDAKPDKNEQGHSGNGTGHHEKTNPGHSSTSGNQGNKTNPVTTGTSGTTHKRTEPPIPQPPKPEPPIPQPPKATPNTHPSNPGGFGGSRPHSKTPKIRVR